MKIFESPIISAPLMAPDYYVDANYHTFIAAMRPFFTDEELEKIGSAYSFARYGHMEQTPRLDGRKYFDHPKTVAWLLVMYFGVYDWRAVVAALLHDIREDTKLLSELRVRINYGEELARAVEQLSKTRFDKRIVGDVTASYFGLLIEAGEWFTQMIKFCDRIHNIATMDLMQLDKVERKLNETEKYFPTLGAQLLQVTPEVQRVSAHRIVDCLDQTLLARRQWLEARRAA